MHFLVSTVVNQTIINYANFTKHPYHGERKLADNLRIVVIALADLRLTRSKMGAYKAQATAVQLHTDGHCTLVSCGTAHARFHGVHGEVTGISGGDKG